VAPTTTTLAPAPATTTTTTAVANVAAQQQQAATTTTTSRSRADRLATTGASQVADLLLVALALVGLGTSALGASGRLHLQRTPVDGLERSVHDLRRALYEHEQHPNAAAAWPMLDALDRLNGEVRQARAASKVARTVAFRSGPHGSGNTIGTSTPPSA
jgi:hypothetical protein